MSEEGDVERLREIGRRLKGRDENDADRETLGGKILQGLIVPLGVVTKVSDDEARRRLIEEGDAICRRNRWWGRQKEPPAAGAGRQSHGEHDLRQRRPERGECGCFEVFRVVLGLP